MINTLLHSAVFHIIIKHSGKRLRKWLCDERQARAQIPDVCRKAGLCSGCSKAHRFSPQRDTVTDGTGKESCHLGSV